MSSITELVKIRYIKPINALREDIIEKVLLSSIAVAISTFGNLVTTIKDIFDVPLELVILLLAAMFADWVTGIKCAKRNNVYIRSLGLSQSWVKLLEYTAGLTVLIGISNVFGSTEINGWVGDALRLLKNIDWLGFFYATFTEFKSIAENTSGKKGRFSEIISTINRKMFGEKDEDQVR